MKVFMYIFCSVRSMTDQQLNPTLSTLSVFFVLAAIVVRARGLTPAVLGGMAICKTILSHKRPTF